MVVWQRTSDYDVRQYIRYEAREGDTVLWGVDSWALKRGMARKMMETKKRMAHGNMYECRGKVIWLSKMNSSSVRRSSVPQSICFYIMKLNFKMPSDFMAFCHFSSMHSSEFFFMFQIINESL